MDKTHLFRVILITVLVVSLALSLAAGAQAQNGAATVTLSRVENQAFPQISLLLTVSDESGPRDDLNAADFQIFEDGVHQVPSEAITLAKDASQGVRLVLALDLSMKAEALAQVKEGAKTLINQLEPQDRVAIIAFYDEVTIVQQFTEDKAALIEAVDNLRPEGNMTAFNQAAVEAVNMVTAFPTGLKAVVMLTNSSDNVGFQPVDDIISLAASAKIPIYVIGFDRVSPEAVETIAAATGGRSFVSSGPEQVVTSAQSVGELLRQGAYKLIFQSGLKADGGEHDMIIKVVYQDKVGEAAGHFTAVPGDVSVSLPSLSEGETVSGTVNLAIQATAPTRLASVAYWLNEELLAEVTGPPYRYEWDTSSLDSGTYRLNVVVTDQAGNTGQTTLNLQVTWPVVVTASVPQTELNIGDQVPIAVKIESLEELARVEYLVDGKLVGTRDTSPYQFSLNTSTYDPGAHRITVRAADHLGRTGETELEMHFLAPVSEPEAPQPGLPERLGFESAAKLRKQASIVAIALVVLIVNLIGLLSAIRTQKRRQQKTYRLEISNLGNVGSYYILRAEDPMGALKFQFMLNGVDLPRLSVNGNGYESPDRETRNKMVIEAGQVSRPIPGAADETLAPTAPPPGAATGSSVKESAGQVMRTGNALASTLTAVGSVLPGSAGSAVQQVARPVYQTQSKINRTTAQARGKAGQVSRLAPGAKMVPPRGAAPSSTQQPRRATKDRQAFATVTPIHPISETCSETPYVDRGETLPIDMLITPLNPGRSQRYSFRVMSKAVEPAESPWLNENGHVQIQGISWFRRLLLFMLFMTVTFVVIGATALLLMR